MQNPWDMDKFTIAWAVAGIWILVWEIWTLLEHRPGEGETLSEHVWWLHNYGGSFAVFMTSAFILWLAYRFILEGR